MRMDRSYAAVTREVTARRNEGRNSVNVPVTSRGTMLPPCLFVCATSYGRICQSQTLMHFFHRIFFPRAWCTLQLHAPQPIPRDGVQGMQPPPPPSNDTDALASLIWGQR